MIATLKQLLPAIERWSEEDQAALVEAAREIESARNGPYCASREELAGIDAGLADSRSGRFASDEEVAALRAKFRAV